MKLTEQQLIALIKKLVQIEAKNAIHNEMQFLINENAMLKQQLQGFKKSNMQPVTEKQSSFKKMMETNSGINKPQIKKQINKPTENTFSKDPIINTLLNETYQEGDWETINFNSGDAGAFKSQMKQEYANMQMESAQSEEFGVPEFNNTMSKRFTSKGMTPPPSVNEMIPEDTKGRLDPDALPDFLQNALTRDYSQIVKNNGKRNQK